MGDINCLSCGQEFGNYQELALHISVSREGHRRGKKWAAKYMSRHIINKRDVELGGRVPLTTEQKINKEDTRRELSGDTEYVNTICIKCNKPSRPLLEAEYVNSHQAWRIGDRLVKLCVGCE